MVQQINQNIYIFFFYQPIKFSKVNMIVDGEPKTCINLEYFIDWVSPLN